MRFPILVEFKGLRAKIYGKGTQGRYYRLVHLLPGHKREQRYFKLLKDARAAAIDTLKRFHKTGHLPVSDSEVIELREIKQKLAASDLKLSSLIDDALAAHKACPGVDLVGAARAWAMSNSSLRDIAFSDAAGEFLLEKRDKVGKRYLEELGRNIRRLQESFKCDVSHLTKDDISLFFNAELKDISDARRKHFQALLGELLDFAVRKDWLPPTHRLKEAFPRFRKKVTKDKPSNLTPEAFRALLEAANHALLPVIAIGGFAGVRIAEIGRLEWRHVWEKEGYIEVPEEISKTSRSRTVPICEALAAWLAPYRETEGRVWKLSEKYLNNCLSNIRATVGIRGKNQLRHSFCSYRLAVTESAEKTALEAGHTTEVLLGRYNKASTPTEAAEYFAIMPLTGCR